MKEFIKLTAEAVNHLHDLLEDFSAEMGYQLTDKDLHFWIFGVLGILFFIFVHLLFIWISTLSMTAISFLYTFTVLLVVVFAIEIQQKITGRGNMEFADAIVGLWGFLVFFFVFLAVKFSYMLVSYMIKTKKQETKETKRFRSSA
ncbi:hypothetical protein P8610_08560 [Fictibacillus sp. UD]|uniref:hypothetical protein n=1 Tax=Fictibacillus sp. UD TaxID=3038777 RepID=UPI003746449F